ncbi:hypothetical protein [Bradyrhizobium liaoningense]|uniref:hypothetical protein n=1 Tax=Bradyrhizobium liaoningense TaxID=43992 RepID=UPI001BAE44B3|nr:hypothetical protein [Bradyrhizobium liaoningense]MBR0707005.1 hypothetical protein [Bradyrhizobium liaoningense]
MMSQHANQQPIVETDKLSAKSLSVGELTPPRTVQTLLQENGRSFQDFVIEEHLPLADRLLRSIFIAGKQRWR